MSSVNIEQIALQCYEKNMNYLQKNHFDVYKKIFLLEEAINQNRYQQKYALEYKNEGYFDVLDIQSQQYLYGENSYDYAKGVMKNTTYKKSENIIESFIYIDQKELYSEHKDLKTPLFATASLIKYIKKIAPDQNSSQMKSIDKMMFLGIGLGTHIRSVLQKTNSMVCLLVEDDIELFRFSLFVTDYEKTFSKRALFISLMENDESEHKVFSSFFTAYYNKNHILKFTLFSNRYTSKIKQFQNFIITQSYIFFPYNLFLQRYIKSLDYILSGESILNISKIYKNSFFSNKPVLILASGPSLENNIDWLRENQDRFILLAVMSSLKILQTNGIKPDVVTHIDQDGEASLKLIKDIDFSRLIDTYFIFSSNIHSDIVQAIKPLKIYFYEQGTDYKDGFGSLSAPSIGEATYALSLILGATQIYLLGIDLALDPTTGKTHSKGHVSEEGFGENEISRYVHLRQTKYKVRGNFLEQVDTLPLFKTSIREFNNFTREYKTENQKVFNLNNGAYLEDTVPMQVKDINLGIAIQKKQFKKDIKTFLDSISSSSVSNVEYKKIEKKLLDTENILSYIKQYEKSKKSYKAEKYLQTLSNFINNILGVNHTKQNDIHVVFYMYFLFISGYIFDLFNTRDFKLSKHDIKELDILFVVEIKKIVNLYLDEMRKYMI